MDHGAVLTSTFEYVKAFCFDYKKWLTVYIFYLINLLTFGIIPLYYGYFVRVMGDKEEKTPANKPGELFILGWKYNLATIIWYLPIIIIGVLGVVLYFVPLFGTTVVSTEASSNANIVAVFGAMMGVLLIILILAIVLTLFYYMALVHMARYNSLRKAFAVKEILAVIRKVGWFDYIIALIIAAVIMFVISLVIQFIVSIFVTPFLVLGSLESMFGALIIIGLVTGFILLPVMVGLYRYFSLIYNEGNEEKIESVCTE